MNSLIDAPLTLTRAIRLYCLDATALQKVGSRATAGSIGTDIKVVHAVSKDLSFESVAEDSLKRLADDDCDDSEAIDVVPTFSSCEGTSSKNLGCYELDENSDLGSFNIESWKRTGPRVVAIVWLGIIENGCVE